MSRIALVLGIRPDVIRASKIIELLDSFTEIDLDFIWSGQHYSKNMKDVFFQQLNVRKPDYEFNIKGNTDAEVVSSTINSLNKHFEKNIYRAVIFLGDTNTVMGAIAAAQHNIPVIHIEGCMRSYDWRMPEEKYRTVVDHLSDRIYAYLDAYKSQGLNEGIGSSRILVTGNPIVDIINEYEGLFERGSELLDKEIKEVAKNEEYMLVTCHRRENILNESSLGSIVDLLNSVEGKLIFPMGYKTQEQIKAKKLKLNNNISVLDPLGYLEFMYLLNNSKYVISDSGTVIEEACILGVPSIQIRRSTERPEVYEVKSSVKFDPSNKTSPEETLSQLDKIIDTKWAHPFGEGEASKVIADDIRQMCKENTLNRHNKDDYPFDVSRSYMS